MLSCCVPPNGQALLVTLDATFADAGSYFGFFDEKLPKLDRRAKHAELQRHGSPQAEFSRLYTDTLDSLRDQLPGQLAPHSPAWPRWVIPEPSVPRCGITARAI